MPTPRNSIPARGPLTPEQIERLRDLAASGPLTRKPIDASLEAARWVEPYAMIDASRNNEAVDLIDGRARMLYDDRGLVRAHWRGEVA